MEWRHCFTHDLDLEAGIRDEYRSFDYHDALDNAGPTSWDTTTYKWLCVHRAPLPTCIAPQALTGG